ARLDAPRDRVDRAPHRGASAGARLRIEYPTVPPDDDGDLPHMVDRFVIEDELGAGAMGRVFLAYDPSLDRRVAVKLVRDRPGSDRAASQARIAHEARAMAKLRHPNVVTVHEVGTHGGDLFIVMEYVAGGTLRDWLARSPGATWQQIVAMYALAGRG